MSEFVYYIYPDGTVLSKNTLFSQQANTYDGSPNGFEYHEAIVINSAGVEPHDNIDIHDTVTLMNMAGDIAVFDGANGGINNAEDGTEPFPQPFQPNSRAC